MMFRAYGPNDLVALPANTAAANPGLPVRSKIGWVKHVNFSPYLFLLVDDTNQVRNVVAPWSVGATELLKEDADTDNLVLVPVVKASQNTAVAQGVWWEFRKNKPALTVDIEPNAPLASSTPQNENLAQVAGVATPQQFGGGVLDQNLRGVGGVAVAVAAAGLLSVGVTDSIGNFIRVGTLGDLNGVLPASPPASTPLNNSPAVNTAAVITYGAVAGQRHRLTKLSASYNAAPTAGNLLVQDGATTVHSEDLSAAGVDQVPLPGGGIQGSVNTAMTITLAAAGAAVTGKLNAAKLTA